MLRKLGNGLERGDFCHGKWRLESLWAFWCHGNYNIRYIIWNHILFKAENLIKFMTTFAWTYYPIQVILEAGGRMTFKDLAQKLMSVDPIKFRDETTVQRAIERYNSCLKSDGAVVTFDRTAKKYARFDIMERDVQSLLHKAIPDMEKWQLYTFKTRANSPTCYIGAPWEYVPKGEEDEEFPRTCNFRGDGTDSCRGGCGIPEEQLR